MNLKTQDGITGREAHRSRGVEGIILRPGCVAPRWTGVARGTDDLHWEGGPDTDTGRGMVHQEWKGKRVIRDRSFGKGVEQVV